MPMMLGRRGPESKPGPADAHDAGPGDEIKSIVQLMLMMLGRRRSLFQSLIQLKLIMLGCRGPNSKPGPAAAHDAGPSGSPHS